MFPRWLSWLFIAVIAYLIYMATQNPSSPKVSPAIPPVTEKTYPALAKATDMEHWKRALNPDYAAKYHCVATTSDDRLGLKITDEEIGTGDRTNCADHIVVHLVVWDTAGKKTYEGETPLEVGIGAIAEGMDMGLVGLRVGGSRTLVIPSTMMKRNKTADKLPPALLHALPAGKLAIVTAKRII